MLTPQEQQIQDAWERLPNHKKLYLVESLSRLAKMFSGKVPDERLNYMAKRLAPYAMTESLYQALNQLGEGERFPSVRQIKASLVGRLDLLPVTQIPDLTPEERSKSSKTAILSMLWLHYAKGWPLSSFKANALGEAYQGDPEAALRAACEIYDKKLVLAWMEDQIRAGR